MRISTKSLQALSDAWIEKDDIVEVLRATSCCIVLPCGEEANPQLKFWFDLWRIKGILNPEPIGPQHELKVAKEEGCYSIPTVLSTAIVIFRCVSADRINVVTSVKLKKLPEETYHI